MLFEEVPVEFPEFDDAAGGLLPVELSGEVVPEEFVEPLEFDPAPPFGWAALPLVLLFVLDEPLEPLLSLDPVLEPLPLEFVELLGSLELPP